MGLIDQIISGALGYAQTTAVRNPMATVQMVMQFVQCYPGGVHGLLNKLRGSGLREQVDSWISGGANLRISGDQLLQAVGREHIQWMAQRFGMDQQQAATSIADLLPEVIDQLTPRGEADQEALQSGLEALKAKIPGL
ncbi:MAG TPA: YidB family protein [Burkholderiales bacterium]|nr:YidB family protein [Burkholderiales bacterium]